MSFLSLIRFVMLLPKPIISRSQAIEIATQEARQLGWRVGVGNPIAMEGLCSWTILINGDMEGSPYIVINNQDGAVRKRAWLPR